MKFTGFVEGLIKIDKIISNFYFYSFVKHGIKPGYLMPSGRIHPWVDLIVIQI